MCYFHQVFLEALSKQSNSLQNFVLQKDCEGKFVPNENNAVKLVLRSISDQF